MEILSSALSAMAQQSYEGMYDLANINYMTLYESLTSCMHPYSVKKVLFRVLTRMFIYSTLWVLI